LTVLDMSLFALEELVCAARLTEVGDRQRRQQADADLLRQRSALE
jgi:hypothetical protein